MPHLFTSFVSPKVRTALSLRIPFGHFFVVKKWTVIAIATLFSFYLNNHWKETACIWIAESRTLLICVEELGTSCAIQHMYLLVFKIISSIRLSSAFHIPKLFKKILRLWLSLRFKNSAQGNLMRTIVHILHGARLKS